MQPLFVCKLWKTIAENMTTCFISFTLIAPILHIYSFLHAYILSYPSLHMYALHLLHKDDMKMNAGFFRFDIATDVK